MPECMLPISKLWKHNSKMTPEFPLSKRVFNFYPGIKTLDDLVEAPWKTTITNVPRNISLGWDTKGHQVKFGEILYYGGTVGHKWGTYIIVD